MSWTRTASARNGDPCGRIEINKGGHRCLPSLKAVAQAREDIAARDQRMIAKTFASTTRARSHSAGTVAAGFVRLLSFPEGWLVRGEFIGSLADCRSS